MSRLLKKLASLKLTVGLLLWLTLLSILGTVIHQHALPPMDGGPFALQVISLFNPRDIFHSLWFLIPTALLVLNAAACMYLRRRAFGGPSSMPKAGGYEVTVPGEADTEAISAGLEGSLKGRYRILRRREEGRVIIQGEKGLLRTVAPIMVHGSIIMILLGVGMSFFGYKGSIEIPVGRTTDAVTLANGTTMHLPFAIRCDDFTMDLYESGMPKEYRSQISFLQKDKLMQRSSVLVNHPVSYSRILFSQSGYNQNLAADLQVAGPAGTNRITVGENSYLEMKDTGFRVHVVKVVEDIMGMGPGVRLVIEKPGKEEELWIFQRFEQIAAMHPGLLEKMPNFNPSLVQPYTFSLNGVSGVYTTILGINRDPGIPMVGLGTVLFLAGICLAFMVVHEKIWISLEKMPQGLTIRIAQSSNGKPSQIDSGILERISNLNGVGL